MAGYRASTVGGVAVHCWLCNGCSLYVQGHDLGTLIAAVVLLLLAPFVSQVWHSMYAS